MKFVICVHQNSFEFIYKVIYMKFVIYLQKNDYEFICDVINMLNLGFAVK
jgi:hypothetical protein